MDSNVKGTFIGQATQNGDLVLYGGQWYQATGTNTSTDTPGTSGSWSAGVTLLPMEPPMLPMNIPTLLIQAFGPAHITASLWEKQ